MLKKSFENLEKNIKLILLRYLLRCSMEFVSTSHQPSLVTAAVKKSAFTGRQGNNANAMADKVNLSLIRLGILFVDALITNTLSCK